MKNSIRAVNGIVLNYYLICSLTVGYMDLEIRNWNITSRIFIVVNTIIDETAERERDIDRQTDRQNGIRKSVEEHNCKTW